MATDGFSVLTEALGQAARNLDPLAAPLAQDAQDALSAAQAVQTPSPALNALIVQKVAEIADSLTGASQGLHAAVDTLQANAGNYLGADHASTPGAS